MQEWMEDSLLSKSKVSCRLFVMLHEEQRYWVDLTWNLINVPLMNLIEAGLLLGNKIGGEDTEDEQPQLLEQWDYLPLAITQAASFMAKR